MSVDASPDRNRRASNRGTRPVRLCRPWPCPSHRYRRVVLVIGPSRRYVSVDEELRHVPDDARYRHEPLLPHAEKSDHDHRHRQRLLRAHQHNSFELSALELENVPADRVVYTKVADTESKVGRKARGRGEDRDC